MPDADRADTADRTLVTGGAGLVGVAVCRRLVELGRPVRIFDEAARLDAAGPLLPAGVEAVPGSVLDLDPLSAAMAGCDRVIHLAAMVGVKRTEQHPLRCMDVNVSGTHHVLAAAAAAGAGKVVFASSSEVYGEPAKNPIDETALTQGRTVYAVSKLAGEELCKGFAVERGLATTILRLFNVYGPWQSRQFVVPLFVDAVRRGEPPVVYGSGEQRRGYAFVTDTADAVVKASEPGVADGETLNVGKGDEPVTLMELAGAAIDAAGRSGEIAPRVLGGFDGSDRRPEREIHHRYCDASKAKRVLQWSPGVSLGDGLKRMFAADPAQALPVGVEGE